MRLRKPTSDEMRQVLLDIIYNTGTKDIAGGTPYVSNETLTAINTFSPLFLAGIYAVEEAKGERIGETAEQKAAFEILYPYVRDMMTVAKKRIIREGLDPQLYTIYQMTQTGELPNLTKLKEWLTVGKALIEGDARSVTAGNEAMANPSAAQLQVVHTNAQKEFDEMAMADRKFDIAQKELAGHRTAAEEWINEVIDELNFSLRKEDNPSKRRVMRSYGFEFEAEAGDEENLPAKPKNLTYLWEDPNLLLTCDVVPTAYLYDFVYSEDNVIWHALHTGAEPTHTYAPPQGARYYKVRAENDYGYGEYSEVIEFTKPEVPQ
jgi:hypothetical protein